MGLLWCEAALPTSVAPSFWPRVRKCFCWDIVQKAAPVLLELPITECAALESFVLHWMVLLTAALSWLASYCLSGVRKACSLSGHCNRPGFPVDGRFSAPAGGTRPLPDLPAAARPREGECRELSGAGELFVTDCWGLGLSENTVGIAGTSSC